MCGAALSHGGLWPHNRAQDGPFGCTGMAVLPFSLPLLRVPGITIWGVTHSGEEFVGRSRTQQARQGIKESTRTVPRFNSLLTHWKKGKGRYQSERMQTGAHGAAAALQHHRGGCPYSTYRSEQGSHRLGQAGWVDRRVSRSENRGREG